MIDVRPVEHVRGLTIAVGRGRRILNFGVIRKIEGPVRAGSRGIDAVDPIHVHSRLNVVAIGMAVHSIGVVRHPPEAVERVRRFVPNQGDRLTPYVRCLRIRAGHRIGRRERRGTVAVVNDVG